jgi:hypothetical protein
VVARGTIDERFAIDSQAASRGMGTIYRGRDLHTGAAVAIKVVHRGGASDLHRFDAPRPPSTSRQIV